MIGSEILDGIGLYEYYATHLQHRHRHSHHWEMNSWGFEDISAVARYGTAEGSCVMLKSLPRHHLLRSYALTLLRSYATGRPHSPLRPQLPHPFPYPVVPSRVRQPGPMMCSHRARMICNHQTLATDGG